MDARVKAILTLYKHGRIIKTQVKKSVPNVISAEEYKIITGEAYKK